MQMQAVVGPAGVIVSGRPTREQVRRVARIGRRVLVQVPVLDALFRPMRSGHDSALMVRSTITRRRGNGLGGRGGQRYEDP